MNDLTITINEDNTVYLEGYADNGDLVLVTRLEPTDLYIYDYRRVKPKRWWNF